VSNRDRGCDDAGGVGRCNRRSLALFAVNRPDSQKVVLQSMPTMPHDIRRAKMVTQEALIAVQTRINAHDGWEGLAGKGELTPVRPLQGRRKMPSARSRGARGRHPTRENDGDRCDRGWGLHDLAKGGLWKVLERGLG
jgi:hypothetical protein